MTVRRRWKAEEKLAIIKEIKEGGKVLIHAGNTL